MTDRPPGAGPFSTTCGNIGRLSPGQTGDCSARYTVTAADLTRHKLTNTAAATAAGLAAFTASASSSPVQMEGHDLPPTGAPQHLVPIGLAGMLFLIAGLALLAFQRLNLRDRPAR